jgi:SAM-dependent methyltransferase
MTAMTDGALPGALSPAASSPAAPSPAASSPAASGHAAASHARIGAASAWVARFASLAPAGEVLDLACGSGRHARLFAALGHPVLAADRDPAALRQVHGLAGAAGLSADAIVTLQVDFETPMTDSQAGRRLSGDCHWPFEAGRFAAIVVTNYLHRPLLPHLLDSLAPGGLLIYETFAAGNAAFGKPSNPAFLLQPGELLHFALGSTPPLRIIAFEDGHVTQPAPAMVQRLCAIRPSAASVVGAGEPPLPQQLRL